MKDDVEKRENHIQNRLTQWNVLETDAGNKRHRKTSIATVDDEEIDEEAENNCV